MFKNLSILISKIKLKITLSLLEEIELEASESKNAHWVHSGTEEKVHIEIEGKVPSNSLFKNWFERRFRNSQNFVILKIS